MQKKCEICQNRRATFTICYPTFGTDYNIKSDSPKEKSIGKSNTRGNLNILKKLCVFCYYDYQNEKDKIHTNII